ncbi:MAG: glutamate racemase, partial [Bacteroidetes bacterium]
MQPSIGVFDSGLGGLTVLKELATALPQYNFTYLGDNARSPYGTRSFSTVYQYTWQCVQWLFQQNCPLVILACNTASAKALRTIQQKHINPSGTTKRVLGVIRP